MLAVRTIFSLPLFPIIISVCVTPGSRVAGQNLTASKVALGEKLYCDTLLSADKTVSCATCHDPATAFASKDVTAIGVQNRIGKRNAATVLNVRFAKSYFWDGRSLTLEDQAKQPLLNPSEMGMISETAIVKRLSSIPAYRAQFSRVFGHEGITLNTIVKNLASR